MELILSISGLIGIWFLVVTIPGPNFVAVTQYSISESRVEGFFIALGVSTSSGIWATASLLGLGVVFVHLPWLYDTIRLVGGLYLIFIGLKIIWAAFNFSLSSLPEKHLSESKYVAFRQGLLTSFSNPKTAAFFGSLFVTVIPPQAPVWVYVITIILIVSISIVWYGLVTFFFSLRRCNLYIADQKGFSIVAQGRCCCF